MKFNGAMVVAAVFVALPACSSSRGRQTGGSGSGVAPGEAVASDADPMRLPSWVVRPVAPDAGRSGSPGCRVLIVPSRLSPIEVTAEAVEGDKLVGERVDHCATLRGLEEIACAKAYTAACAKLPADEECISWTPRTYEEPATRPTGVRLRLVLSPNAREVFKGLGMGDTQQAACDAAEREACTAAKQAEGCVAAGSFFRNQVDYPFEVSVRPPALQLVCPADRRLVETERTSYCAQYKKPPGASRLEDWHLDGPFLLRDASRPDLPEQLGTYRNGKKQGVWQSYQDGVLIHLETYDANLNDGPDLAWWPSTGRPEHTGNYRRGAPHGSWVSYDEDGRLAGTATYSEGRLLSSTGKHAARDLPLWQGDDPSWQE
jgi:hypothetical protein